MLHQISSKWLHPLVGYHQFFMTCSIKAAATAAECFLFFLENSEKEYRDSSKRGVAHDIIKKVLFVVITRQKRKENSLYPWYWESTPLLVDFVLQYWFTLWANNCIYPNPSRRFIGHVQLWILSCLYILFPTSSNESIMLFLSDSDRDCYLVLL